MSTLVQRAPQMQRRTLRRRRAPRGRCSKNVLSPVKVAASGGSLDAADHEVDHESALAAQNDATWKESEKVLQQHLNGPNNLITVKEIEKCLRYTNESAANIGLKNNSQVNMEMYLNQQLSEVLFGRDIMTVDVDLDSPAKRLSSDYGNGSHNLYYNKEDDYILPEFQLDNLDQLDYCTDEIRLAGDFSPSNGTLLPCNISNVNTKDLIIRLQETINKFNDSNKNLENIQVQKENCVRENVESTSRTMSIQDLILENTSYNELNVNNQNDWATHGNLELQSSPQTELIKSSVKKCTLKTNNVYSKAKSTFQSNIITRRRALMNKEQNISNQKESMIERAKKNSISESHENEQDENLALTLRPYSHLNPQEIAIAKALFEIGIKDSMLKHIYTPDKIKIWVCHLKDCERQFSKLCYLKTHILQHYGVKPFKCDYEGCSWAFYADVKLQQHKETHLKKKNFACSIPGCKGRFTTIYNLRFHEKQHSRSNRLSCQIPNCTKKFQKKHDLELHMKSHSEFTAPYICSFDGCGKRFYTNNTLMAHRRCHNRSNEDITCSWPGCGKTFDHPCRLKTHMRFHTGTKPYACTIKGCKWAFSTASKLKRHQKKHTNDRKFACDVENCKKTFVRSEHLKNHKLGHFNKFFQCHYCSSSFTTKAKLYAHIKHRGNKESAVCRKAEEKTTETKEITRQKEFVCSTVQPLRLSIKRVCKKLSADKTETKRAADVQGTKRKSVRKNQPNFENKGKDSSNTVCTVHDKSDSQKLDSSLSEIQKVTHVISSSLNSQEELVATIQKTQNLDFELQSASKQIENTAGNEGSARTALTRVHVLSLKPNRGDTNSNEKESDIVLDVANIGDGFIQFEDLMPFAYCQDDTGIPVYQILLLNSETAENESSVQNLD